MTIPRSIKINENTAAVAFAVFEGGRFYYDELLSALGIHRETLNTALSTLEDLGAITYQPAAKGRPRKDSRGPSTLVTVQSNSWVWEALGLVTP
jgi:transcription initiation factor IIE alpha subunit